MQSIVLRRGPSVRPPSKRLLVGLGFAACVGLGSTGLGCTNKGNDDVQDDSGTGVADPEILVSVSEVAFESIAVGSSAQKSFTVQNFGGRDLDLQGVAVGAPFRTTFTNLVTLHPGGAHTVTVLYMPTDNGDYEEVLSITSTDPLQPTVDILCKGDTISDADGDGFNAGDDPGEDCDDDDEDIHPGAEEVWYNGEDDNCACDNDRCSDLDQDGDGYDSENYNSDPESYGGDCKDTDPAFHPGAEDTWYDGYDTDCDGALDYDQDQDGYSSEEFREGGTDCDDLDPDIHPYDESWGIETWNGSDDDCNDYTDFEILATNATWTFVGADTRDNFGAGLTIGNLDSGYESELIAGAPGYSTGGAVTVFEGGELPKSGSDMTMGAALLTGTSGDDLGTEVAWLEDFGTMGATLVVGGPGYSTDKGYAALLDGGDVMTGATLAAATGLRIEGLNSSAFVGQALSNDLDLDADGLTELMGTAKSGASISLWLLQGDSTLTGTQTTSAVDARFSVTGTDTSMIDSFPGGGTDFDGDGKDDFLFCNSSGGTAGYGEVWVLWGGEAYENASPEAIGTAGSTIATGSASLGLGDICGSAGDWDGDGNDEIWIYAYATTDFYVVAGDALLREAPIAVESGALAIYHFDGLTNDPVQLRDIGDVDEAGDGRHEMAVSMSSTLPDPSTIPGQVFILGADIGFGDVTTSVEYLAQGLFYGDEEADHVAFGEAIAGRAGDVTGLGGTYRPDFVLADPDADTGTGSVFLFANYNE
jgi:hypothetical protein